MINLLKYDLKRNSTLLGAGAGILIVALAAILVVGQWRDWGFLAIYLTSIMLFIIAGVLGFVLTCNTYRKNITSYSRRLLPVPSLHTVTTPIIALIAMVLILVGIYVLYDVVLSTWGGFETTLIQAAKENITASGWISILFGLIWMTVCVTTLVFFSMTIGETIKGKGGAWIGIAVFFGLAYGLSMLQSFLFPSDFGSGGSDFVGFQMEEDSGSAMVSFGGMESINWASIAVDAALIGLLLAGTIYLLNRKVKV
ncbi:hypothetical protein ACX93W_07060 [Paenibacillus sp. CAU 1782]